MTQKKRAAARGCANGPENLKHFDSNVNSVTFPRELLRFLHRNDLYSDCAMLAAMRDHQEWGRK